MTDLSEAQVAGFERDGFVFPIDVMAEGEAAALRAAVEAAEAGATGDPTRAAALKSAMNLVLPFAADLVRDPRITDPVAALLGPDLLLWGCALFAKEPGSGSFISWHQDVHYWGLEDAAEVTAWLALTPATEANGCMRFLPGSHLSQVAHRDTFAAANMLSRGQEIAVEVDEAATVPVVLKPGQMSLHHGLVFHASHPNRSDDRRIGLALRYVPTANRQQDGTRKRAMLARGEDRFGHFDLTPPPARPWEPAALAAFAEDWERMRPTLFRDTPAAAPG